MIAGPNAAQLTGRHMGQMDIAAPKTILVVDDDAALRNSLEFSLGIEGYDVRAYASGSALLAEDNFPESGCMIIDQRLPDIQGLKLIDVLRERAIMLPAILVTTHPTRALRRYAAEANVPIVEKPFLTGMLFQRISAAFK
ncbi:MAG: response regulator [Afipia sp.]|nr:response regulator [Afipia sp.]